MIVMWMNSVDDKTVSGGSDMLTESALSDVTDTATTATSTTSSSSTSSSSSRKRAGEDQVEAEAIERRLVETQLGTRAHRHGVDGALVHAVHAACSSVPENVCNNSKNVKSHVLGILKKTVKRTYSFRGHLITTQLPKVSTGKSPTSNSLPCNNVSVITQPYF